MRLEEFGQMAVPSMCHLQHRQEKINHITLLKNRFGKIALITSHLIYFYLRIQGTSNGQLPLFGKHTSHVKVAITADCAIQTIRLTGKIYLKNTAEKLALFYKVCSYVLGLSSVEWVHMT